MNKTRTRLKRRDVAENRKLILNAALLLFGTTGC